MLFAENILIKILSNMNEMSDNFISISTSVDCYSGEVIIQEDLASVDTLAGINDEVPETKYYKLDSVVFAEPLESQREPKEENNEITFMENIVVQKMSGRKNYKYHIEIKDPENPICPKSNCSKPFSSVTLLKAHIRKVHCAQRKFVCESCGAQFSAQYLLNRHREGHVGRTVQCSICQVMLSKNTNLKQHMRSHSTSRAFECDACHKRFLRKSTLDVHVQFVHRTGDLECRQCLVKFKSRSEWTRHMSSHRKKK